MKGELQKINDDLLQRLRDTERQAEALLKENNELRQKTQENEARILVLQARVRSACAAAEEAAQLAARAFRLAQWDGTL